MINAMTTMPKYESYKDSEISWIDEIPSDWKIKKVKFINDIYNGNSLNENFKKKFESQNLEELPYISSKDINVDYSTIEYENGLRIPRGLSQYKVAPTSSSLICIEGGSAGRKIAYTEKDVCFVNKLACFKPKHDLFPKFGFYLLKSQPFQLQFQLSMSGLIGGVPISRLNNFSVCLPSLEAQKAIADFLDEKTKQLDEAIKIKEKQIALLKERKQIIIQNAVTKGLNPKAPMKDSGVDWLGDIPSHWKVKRLKYVLDERNERSKTGEEPLFMVSQVHGLVVRSEYHDKAEVAESNIDNKIVHMNDLVFNKLKAHLGVFFKSNIDFEGLVSPDYAVYKAKSHISDLKYLEHLFRHPAYIEQFIIRATGIVEGLIRLYTDDLFDIFIPIPPAEEQKEILSQINIIEEQHNLAEGLQRQQIDKLKEYKASLINSAVTGKIKVI